MSHLYFPDRKVTDLFESITPSDFKKAEEGRIAGPTVMDHGRTVEQLRLSTVTTFTQNRFSETEERKPAVWVRILPKQEILDFVWTEMGGIADWYSLKIVHQLPGTVLILAEYSKILGSRWLWRGTPEELPVMWRRALGLDVHMRLKEGVTREDVEKRVQALTDPDFARGAMEWASGMDFFARDHAFAAPEQLTVEWVKVFGYPTVPETQDLLVNCWANGDTFAAFLAEQNAVRARRLAGGA